MASVFRSDILNYENSLFFKNTFLIPSYLNGHKYEIDQTDMKRIINDVKEDDIRMPKGNLSINDSYLSQNFMKKCFDKCRQFVLEDWIDYDELDCTMKCTLVHKESLEVMKDVFTKM